MNGSMFSILRILISLYLTGSLIYATLHLFGFTWSPSSNDVSSSSPEPQNSLLNKLDFISVSQLQQKYHSAQTVTLNNAEGKTQKAKKESGNLTTAE
jgi:hypothetical protein